MYSGPAAAFDQAAAVQYVSFIKPATTGMKNGNRFHVCHHDEHATPCGYDPSATPVKPDVKPGGGDGPVKFMINNQGWDGPGQGCFDFQFFFANGTGDIDGNGEQTEIIAAMNTWAAYAAVTFTEVFTAGLPATIDISWALGAHGDGFPHDGPAGQLAHVFNLGAGEPLQADLHFDDAENWYVHETGVGTPLRIDLYTIALHEIGHILGIGHSENEDAVMHETYEVAELEHTLHPDDIAAVKSIYRGYDWEHGHVDPLWADDDFNVAGDIDVALEGQIHYRTNSGRMAQKVWTAANSWTTSWVAPNWTTNSENIKEGGAIAINPVSGQTFYHGENNKLQNMFFSNGVWNHGYPDPLWNDPQYNVAGAIECAPNGQVRYRANNGRMVNKFFNNSGWNTAYVAPNWSTQWENIKEGGAIAIGPGSSQTFYHGQDDKIQNMFFANGVWNHGWVAPDFNSDDRDVKGDIEVAPNGDVFYHGKDDMLHQLSFVPGTGWTHAIVLPQSLEIYDVAGDIEIAPNGQVRYRMDNGKIANIYMTNMGWARGILEPLYEYDDWNMKAGGAMAIGPHGQTYYHADFHNKMQNYYWIGPCSGKTNDQSGSGESLEAANNASPRLSTAPNPFGNRLELILDMPADGEMSIDLMDMQGRIVASPVKQRMLRAGQHSFELQTEQLPAGMYFARMQQGMESQSVKVIKAN